MKTTLSMRVTLRLAVGLTLGAAACGGSPKPPQPEPVSGPAPMASASVTPTSAPTTSAPLGSAAAPALSATAGTSAVAGTAATAGTAAPTRKSTADHGKPKATVTVTIDPNLMASVKPSADLTRCLLQGDVPSIQGLSKGGEDLSKAGASVLLRPSSSAAAPRDQFLQSLVRPGVSLLCGEDPVNVVVKPPSGTLRSSTPVIAPDYEWTDLDTLYGPGLRAVLGDPTACKYLPDGQTAPASGGASCTFSPYSPPGQPSGTHYRMQIAGSPTTGAIGLTMQGKQTLDLSIATCSFATTGPLQVVVPGARRQTLSLKGSLPACGARLSGQGQPAAISLVNGDKTINGSATGADSVGLDLQNVRADLAPGTSSWEVHDAGGALIGKVSLQTVNPLAVDPTLEVAYADPELDKAQTGKSAAKTAVVDPWLDLPKVNGRPDRRANVTNTAIVTVPAEIGAASVGASAFKAPPGGLAWTASDTALALADVTLLGTESLGAGPLQHDLLIPNLRRLAFRVTRRTTSGVTIPLKLWHAEGKADAKYEVPLLEVDLKVADEARIESVPFPIAKYLQIACGTQDEVEHVAGNGALVSIAEGALPNGECKAHLDYGLIDDDLGKPERAYLLRLYGPQTVSVTVARSGATAATDTWTLNLDMDKVPLDHGLCQNGRRNPKLNEGRSDLRCQRDHKLADELALPAPTADKGGTSDPYVVDIVIAASDGGQVLYRQSPDTPPAGADAPKQPLTRYHAQLRSRGTFGFDCAHTACVRAFLSVPVDVFGVRFGASAIDLKSSTATIQFQVLGPRVGLLAGVELWDYERSKPYFPVFPRVVVGMYAFQFTQPNVALSWMKGLQFAIPVLQASGTTQLDTSVSLGFYWETDLRDNVGSAAAQHFVVTSSLNVLNLFGAK